ncbi:MAG TPA: hypothetical protein VK803_12415 [Steroidobacteraceae bacterium]|jgi:hypothetical protein|nr:hypothetical protein [Steroidobacteraceae bacterium]
MPFHEADPWRLQYFAGVACPPDVRIPTDDPDAYCWYPQHRWIFDKLRVTASQGLQCAPHGVYPEAFPVFSKPLTNLLGMGVGSRVLADRADYQRHMTPGHFWMTLLQGEHVSSDIAVEQGRACWWRHCRGTPAGRGTFDYWVVEAGARQQLEASLAGWIARHLGAYTGMLNLETIDGRIIDAHLRFADQWPDLYGAGWLDAVVGLYARGSWQFADRERRDGYSVVLFGPHGREYRHPPASLVERVRAMAQVTSVQITFHPERPAAAHPMPPGGFRLAIVNCLDLAAGRDARRRLAEFFGV